MRLMFRIMKSGYKKIDTEGTLRYVVKVLNDAMCVNELISFLLVSFRIYLPSNKQDAPGLEVCNGKHEGDIRRNRVNTSKTKKYKTIIIYRSGICTL